MKTKQRNITLVILLCAFIAALALLFTLGNTRESVVWADVTIKSEYALGTEFEVPELTANIGGTNVKATSSLEFPDGSATHLTTVTLDQAGEYHLRYTAKAGTTPYVQEYDFCVHNPVISYGERTSVSWGKHLLAEKEEGLLVRLAQNEELKFSTPFNVQDMTMTNTLVRGFITPDIQGANDFNELFFTFTDSRDPSIYLKISLRHHESSYGHSYFRAQGNGQPMSGFATDGKTLHQNNIYGFATNVSFTGLTAPWSNTPITTVAVDKVPFSVAFDYAPKVFIGCGGNVIDLDNPLYFDAPWTGFPSGYAFLSISAAGYTGGSANFCLTNVLGTELKDYESVYKDMAEPEIYIQTDYDRMPEARVGGTYPVPEATAFDTYCGATEVKAYVYFNYNNPTNRFLVDIVDGKFATDYFGYYTIVYEATDDFGNRATKLLSIHAVEDEDIPPIDIELPGQRTTSAVFGEWVEILPPEAMSGGSGALSCAVSVSLGNETYPVEKGGFRFEKAGHWTVNYTVTDFIGTVKTESYEIEIQVGDAPVLVDEISLPKVFIAGQRYIIPEAYANDYTSGSLVRKLFDVRVSDANGLRLYSAGAEYVPAVRNNGDQVTLSYRIDGEELTSFTVPVIFAWTDTVTPSLLVENYFSGSPFAAQKTSDGLIMQLPSALSDAGWTYANAVLAENFELVLSAIAGGAQFEKMQITLSDALDPAVSVNVDLIPDGAKTKVALEGSAYSVDGSFEQSGSRLTLGYAGGMFTLNSLSVPFTRTERGEPFEGFPTDKLYVTVRLVNAQSGAGYRVVSLNGYPFTDATRDRVGPAITMLGGYGGNYTLGDEYVINRAVAGDVLSPNVVFTMSVRTPSGAYAKDKNGTVLQDVDPTLLRLLTLEEYGSYAISYTAAEVVEFVSRPTQTVFNYNIIVEDRVAPEITFAGDFRTAAKVGDALVIPNFTVSDNVTASENLIVTKYVLNPDGKLIMIPANSNAITCSKAGIYEFRIIVRDEAGNTAMVRARVTVTE